MLEQIVQNNLGLVLTGTVGAAGAYFFAYYILFALFMIFAPIFSTIKLLAEHYGAQEAVCVPGANWNGSLGYTMPDGGKEVDKKKKDKTA
ncbi:MAG: hypothetical protein KAK02_09095 [Desulfobulbaceae bacterium]|nr:hypothetical protein [Desulfobulbaceae bacterium]